MDRLFLETQRPVTLEAIRELRHLLEQVVRDTVPYPWVRQRILLCLSEAVTNLVQHAAISVSKMIMRFGRDTLGWWLEILDDGTPWDPTKYVELGHLNKFIETEAGRGISLLHMQCDDFDYHPSNDSQLNCLRLSWKTPHQNKRPRVLIVEDDNSLRQIYSIYLNGAFEVTTAVNGKDALLKLKSKQIDLVVSDICMPQMNGVALREHLINDVSSRLIPFVFLTAVNSPRLMEHAANLGIDDYLHKPIDKTQLILIIQRVLKRSQQINQQITERLDKSITSSLTPELPEHSHGWRFALASRHTGGGGGDLLLHQSTDSMFQLVLADIMGHDDNAKFFAHACGGYIHGMMHALGSCTDSAQLLERLSNFAMQDKLLSQVMLTCVSAMLAPEGKICLASAGHPEPLLISRKGIEIVSVGGILPGLLKNTTYKSKTLKLAAGERIALYTDGLFESAIDNNARKDLESAIMTSLITTIDSPIKQSLDKTMNIFDTLAGATPTDDALLILLEPIIIK